MAGCHFLTARSVIFRSVCLCPAPCQSVDLSRMEEDSPGFPWNNVGGGGQLENMETEAVGDDKVTFSEG